MFLALDEGIMSPPDEYTNQLRVVTHTKTPKEIGNVFMKAIVGISRLHSLKTMQVGIIIFFQHICNLYISYTFKTFKIYTVSFLLISFFTNMYSFLQSI